MFNKAQWKWIHSAREHAGGVLLFLGAFSCAAADWPQYRGAGHDGVSSDRILKQWSGSVTNPLWRISLPNGLGSFAVSGGRAFTLIRRDVNGQDKELCAALDAASGQELWATPVDDANYPDGGVGNDDGPRSTPSVDSDSVYVLSSYLKLYRLNVTNGAVIWDKNLLALYGGSVIGWQNAASPLIEDGLVYVNANCAPQRILALRTTDGSLAWRSQNEAMTQSTPVMATIHGVRQAIFATQSGLLSLNPQTGDRLWRFDYPFNYLTSLAASPVVHEDIVFISGAQVYGMRGVAMRATFTNNLWSVSQLWTTNLVSSHWMTPVCHAGAMYGLFGAFQFDGPAAQLKCVDLATGTQHWSVNNFGRGGIALVDNHLVVLAENGELVLVKADTNACTELGRFLAIPGYDQFNNKCWNSPAIAAGRVYVRSTTFGAAFDFSLPDLRLDSPLVLAGGQFQLTVRTTDGSPLDSNRLAALEVRAGTNLSDPVSSWPALTNALLLSNGTARSEALGFGALPQQFFILREQPQP